MKKVICLLLAFMMLLAISGCENDSHGIDDGTVNRETTDTGSSVNEDDTNTNTSADIDSANEGSSVNKENPSNSNTQSNKIDVDLTVLSSTMVYAEVYNMLVTPEKYLGKTVKMDGNFAVYHDETTGKYYFACLIADATSCCSQGIEFVLDGNYSYPNDYPQISSVITVTGIFDTYEENGYKYCQLINATME